MPRRRSSAVDHEIGRLVRLRRLDVGLSQTDLAKALGLMFQQVQKYETDMNRMSAGRLKEIVRKVEVSMSYFHKEAVGCSPQSQPAFKLLDSAYSLRLMRSFARIKAAKRNCGSSKSWNVWPSASLQALALRCRPSSFGVGAGPA